MTDDELKAAIFRLLSRIAPEVDDDTVDPDEPLQQSLDIDSFDYLNLLVAIRDELGVTIDESDYDQLTTLSDMLRYLKARLG